MMLCGRGKKSMSWITGQLWFKRVVHHNIQFSFHPIHPGQLQSSHHWDWCLNWSRKPLLLIITTSNMSPMTDEERPWEEKPSKQFNRGKNIGMFGFCRCYSFLLISFIVTVYWGRDSIPITGLWECHKRQSDYLIAPSRSSIYPGNEYEAR